MLRPAPLTAALLLLLTGLVPGRARADERYLDSDGDRWIALVDCDDDNPYVHPRAPEFCDGLDNDCDGMVDPGCARQDQDEDGFTEAEGDCDDGNPRIYPGALELCDGIDNDCDEAIDRAECIYDNDRDGWLVADGDCHDANKWINPAAREDCDGWDNDCDGQIDRLSCRVDLDRDGFTEEQGDCDEQNRFVAPGAFEYCDGEDNDCNGLTDDRIHCLLVDFDGDGSPASDDCDDTTAAVGPQAREICDGLDNDCDGLVDVGCEPDEPTPTPAEPLPTGGCTPLPGGAVSFSCQQHPADPASWPWLALLLGWAVRRRRAARR